MGADVRSAYMGRNDFFQYFCSVCHEDSPAFSNSLFARIVVTLEGLCPVFFDPMYAGARGTRQEGRCLI
jgi:hypothetical protein